MSGSKKVAIVQPNYIPWKGYFDLINTADEFILLDDVQYTKRDWRNRNKIKTAQGSEWLTIPVETKHKYLQKINECQVSSQEWREKHWKAIEQGYAKAPYFKEYQEKLQNLYLTTQETLISEIDARFITTLCDWLGIRTTITHSTAYPSSGAKLEKIVSLCQAAKADVYISGPKAKSYLKEEEFGARGIELMYFDYNGYPPYRQLHGEFDHFVSILDLILNEGPKATRYMKSF